MKALAKTAFRMVYPKQDEPHPEWQRSDYIALVVVSLVLALVYGFWPV